MTLSLVSTVEVGSGGASSIEWTGIPQTGTDLVVLFSLRNGDTGTSDALLLNFNGSTANFTDRTLYGTGASAASTSSTRDIIGGIVGNGATASTFSNVQLYIPNYAGSTAKSWSADAVAETNGSTTRHSIVAGLWNNTAAITSISVAGGYNFSQYSSASLYTVTKGSGGASVA